MSSFISYTISVQAQPSAGSGNSSVNPPGIVFERYPLKPHLLIYDLFKVDCFVAVTMSSHISYIISKHFPPLRAKLFYHGNSEKKLFIVLSTNMAALTQGDVGNRFSYFQN